MTATPDTAPGIPGEEAWGPLAEPVHADAAGPDDPVWKENVYLSFWDLEAGVHGSLHLSTSPNGEGGRRARCSVGGSGVGRTVEVIEELPVGAFTSDSIHFGLDGHVRVDHPEVALDLVNTPLFTPADFGAGGAIPELVPGQPLRHYQQGTAVAGTVAVDGRTVAISAHGMRDRTWGFRDESSMWSEYIGLVAVFGERFLTVLKFAGMDGTTAADGFLVDAAGATRVRDWRIRRDAAALFVSTRLELDDGRTVAVSTTGRSGGFWVPMGRESDGPALGTYDDFLRLELDGEMGDEAQRSSTVEAGAGFVEQAVLHRAC